MKKLLFSVLITAFSVTSHAQKFEIQLGYGSPSLYSTTFKLAEEIGNIFVGTDVSPDSKGVLNAAFLLKSDNENWKYGIELTNEFFDTNDKIKSQNLLSILPKVDYVWLNATGKFRMYSGVAAGITMVSAKYKETAEEKDWSEANFAYNITPLGIRYGGNLGVFLETNIGMKGFAQAGISYSF